MSSRAERLSDAPFAEAGIVEHDGREFSALGASESDDGKRLAAYDYGDRIGSWDGAVTFGRVVRRRKFQQWSPFGGGQHVDMESIRVRRPDGTHMIGRHSGGGFVRLREVL